MTMIDRIELTSGQQAVLDGRQGDGAAIAMRIVVRLAQAMGATRLRPISGAHIDSCLFHGQSGLDFVDRLVAGISAAIARYGVNITNLQAVFKGGDNPGNNIMIYEVDIPTDIDRQAFYQELRQTAESLVLDISIQHRNIFETINRI